MIFWFPPTTINNGLIGDAKTVPGVRLRENYSSKLPYELGVNEMKMSPVSGLKKLVIVFVTHTTVLFARPRGGR